VRSGMENGARATPASDDGEVAMMIELLAGGL
jgi:hypothetical protein